MSIIFLSTRLPGDDTSVGILLLLPGPAWPGRQDTRHLSAVTCYAKSTPHDTEYTGLVAYACLSPDAYASLRGDTWLTGSRFLSL